LADGGVAALGAEGIAALDVCDTSSKELEQGCGRGDVGLGTHVMTIAVSIWKNNPTIFKAPERNAPILVQRANSPVKREQTAKKRPIRTNANMKRVRRKNLLFPMNCSGTPSVVPNVRPLGGSRG
jgi:hypothetical protein